MILIYIILKSCVIVNSNELANEQKIRVKMVFATCTNISIFIDSSNIK